MEKKKKGKLYSSKNIGQVKIILKVSSFKLLRKDNSMLYKLLFCIFSIQDIFFLIILFSDLDCMLPIWNDTWGYM